MVVADSEVESAKGVVSALTAWGLQPVLVHDGVEAMLAIQRMLPRIVILDAALPKMYGFQVCEVIKRNDSLRDTRVVLVGAIHNQERYHRPPTDLYGADCYLERPDLPEGLESVIKSFGIELREGLASAPAPPSAPEPAAVAPSPAAVAPSPAAPASEFAGLEEAPADDFSGLESPAAESVAPGAEAADELADERSEAERLARIIVSDVILYQPDKFAEGLRNGNVVAAMEAGIEEGRMLFRQRIDSRVREEKDYIIEELMRVARERGMQ
ncbi:MAG: response regulator [Deltaproteobacteria bacterium]|nr:response regulator [Deltaproteobacteria bacterium]MBW2417232.1 response regulator [Deltaproteobacteria bacterium]